MTLSALHTIEPFALTFRPLTEEDIPAVQRLARTIWLKSYPGILSDEQIAYMLEMMYSTDSLREQMRRHRFLLAEERRRLLGYASLEEQQPGVFFIHKFYVDSERHGSGIGKAMMDKLVQLAEPSTLLLQVNCRNWKAINFYFKCGFVICGTSVADIGGGHLKEDFDMMWVRA